MSMLRTLKLEELPPMCDQDIHNNLKRYQYTMGDETGLILRCMDCGDVIVEINTVNTTTKIAQNILEMKKTLDRDMPFK